MPGLAQGCRQEAGILHQGLVPLLFVINPGRILGTDHHGLIEGAVLHQGLPFRGFTHLLEHIDVIVDLFLGGFRRREESAQHDVFDIETLRFACRDIAP